MDDATKSHLMAFDYMIYFCTGPIDGDYRKARTIELEVSSAMLLLYMIQVGLLA